MVRYKQSQVKDSPYWCTQCDRVQVTDDNGTYYGQFGHAGVYGKVGGYALGAGEYTQVVFAVCNSCKPIFFSHETIK